jgi:hypothetical protein
MVKTVLSVEKPTLEKVLYAPVKINFIKIHDGTRLHLDLGIEDLLNDALRRFKDEVSTSTYLRKDNAHKNIISAFSTIFVRFYK